jgi:LemA protein
MKTAWIVFGVVVLAIVVTLFGSYNSLVTLDEDIDAAWGQVQTVLQRRYDLIPNLVNTVKGYASHEKEVLEEVTRLRSQWGQARTADEQIAASGAMESALARLMVVVEQYPDLKANQNFLALQDELAGTENRISVERGRFNNAVREYNRRIRRFPGRFVAGFAGLKPRKEYFQAADAAAAAPKVEF